MEIGWHPIHVYHVGTRILSDTFYRKLAQRCYEGAATDRDVVLHLSASGGSVECLGLVDDAARHLESAGGVLAVIADRKIQSAAVDLMVLGTTGYRVARRHTRFMVHSTNMEHVPRKGLPVQLNASALRLDLATLDRLNQEAVERLAPRTKLPRELWHEICHNLDRDLHFGAYDAKSFGIVDHVLKNPLSLLRRLRMQL